MWVSFNDMHSGGGTKVPPYEQIYIQANSEAEAVKIFIRKFSYDPTQCSCHTCGDDYSIDTDDSILQLSGYHRGCEFLSPGKGRYNEGRYFEPGEKRPKGWTGGGSSSWRKHQTIEQYAAQEDICIVGNIPDLVALATLKEKEVLR